MPEEFYYKGRDSWFDKWYADKITPDFAQWWFDTYGHPDQYPDGVSEYFVRMSFAFLGWEACEKKMAQGLKPGVTE